MKKIGMIVLALVIALGTIGVGYAMWSDTVYIEGEVSTGKLALDVEYYSCSTAYKNLENSGIVMHYYVTLPDGTVVNDIYNPSGANIYDPPAPFNPLSVAQACAKPAVDADGTLIDDTVTMSFNNVFPTVYSTGATGIYADVIVHYTGTIPGHIVWNFSSDNVLLNWLYAKNYINIFCFRTTVTPDADRGEPYIDYTVEMPLLLKGDTIQVENCQQLKLNVYVDLPQCDDQVMLDAGYECEDFMGLDKVEFDIQISAEQWNEAQWP